MKEPQSMAYVMWTVCQKINRKINEEDGLITEGSKNAKKEGKTGRITEGVKKKEREGLQIGKEEGADEMGGRYEARWKTMKRNQTRFACVYKVCENYYRPRKHESKNEFLAFNSYNMLTWYSDPPFNNDDDSRSLNVSYSHLHR